MPPRISFSETSLYELPEIRNSRTARSVASRQPDKAGCANAKVHALRSAARRALFLSLASRCKVGMSGSSALPGLGIVPVIPAGRVLAAQRSVRLGTWSRLRLFLVRAFSL